MNEEVVITYDKLESLLNEMGKRFDITYWNWTLTGNGHRLQKPVDLTDAIWEQLVNENYNAQKMYDNLTLDDNICLFYETYKTPENIIKHAREYKNNQLLDEEDGRYKSPPFDPIKTLDMYDTISPAVKRELLGSELLEKAKINYFKALWILNEKAPFKSKKKIKHTKGYVYLLKIKDDNIYKIGMTNNLDKRIEQISPQMPFESELYYHIKTNDRYKLETELHEKFTDKNVNGEWFRLNESDIKYIKSIEGDK